MGAFTPGKRSPHLINKSQTLCLKTTNLTKNIAKISMSIRAHPFGQSLKIFIIDCLSNMITNYLFISIILLCRSCFVLKFNLGDFLGPLDPFFRLIFCENLPAR